MLMAVRLSDQVRIAARDVVRPTSLEAEAKAIETGALEFACPLCHSPVILKQGRKVIHHFAHKPMLSCQLGRPETFAHLQAKQEIFDTLKALQVEHVEMECNFGVSIADVAGVINGVPVAVEIQQSGITVDEVIRRTVNYRSLGIFVLWARLMPSGFGGLINPKSWERWFHAAYFGRVYYWMGADIFLPIHFQPVEKWVEGRDWYDENGSDCSSDGYFKIMKKQAVALPGHQVRLAKDFRPVKREAFRDVPECNILVDVSPKWWNGSPMQLR